MNGAFSARRLPVSKPAMFQSADPVAVYASDKALFGDLTEREDFAALLREKIADVYALIN